MNLGPRNKRQPGFTLIELLVALGIFLLVTGAAFTLLGTSQKQYQTESQVLNSFQEARLGLDQIVRDVDDSGYPPPNHFSVLPAANFYAATPFAASPNSACVIGITCASPQDFDLIVETSIDPVNNASVQWVRYQLPAGGCIQTSVEYSGWRNHPDCSGDGDRHANRTATSGGTARPRPSPQSKSIDKKRMNVTLHRRRKHSEAGVALLIAISALLLISVVAIALIVAAGMETSLSGNYRSSTGAYYAARAGLEEGRGRLLTRNPDYFNATSPAFIPPTLTLHQVRYVTNP